MNAIYPKFLEALWAGSINAGSDTFRVAALSSAYVYSAAHQFHSSLTGVLGIATLSGVTTVDGVFDADDPTISGLSAGTIVALVIYKWTGSSGTSPLAAYIDVGTGFGVAPSGSVQVVWSNLVSKIFPLGGVT